MNTNDEILKILAVVLKSEGYNRTIVYGKQKPKNTTYLSIVPLGKNRVSVTTGGAVYDNTIAFRYFTNSAVDYQDEIDKVTNAFDNNTYYRDSTKTYYFNSTMDGWSIDEEQEHKIEITYTFRSEEVA